VQYLGIALVLAVLYGVFVIGVALLWVLFFSITALMCLYPVFSIFRFLSLLSQNSVVVGGQECFLSKLGVKPPQRLLETAIITEEDKKELLGLVRQETKLVTELKEQTDAHDALESDLDGRRSILAQNKDGSVSQRSNAGKVYHDDLERLWSINSEIDLLQDEIEENQEQQYLIKVKPNLLRKACLELWATKYAGTASFTFVLVSFPMLFLYLGILSSATEFGYSEAYLQGFLLFGEGLDQYLEAMRWPFVSFLNFEALSSTDNLDLIIPNWSLLAPIPVLAVFIDRMGRTRRLTQLSDRCQEPRLYELSAEGQTKSDSIFVFSRSTELRRLKMESEYSLDEYKAHKGVTSLGWLLRSLFGLMPKRAYLRFIDTKGSAYAALELEKDQQREEAKPERLAG